MVVVGKKMWLAFKERCVWPVAVVIINHRRCGSEAIDRRKKTVGRINEMETTMVNDVSRASIFLQGADYKLADRLVSFISLDACDRIIDRMAEANLQVNSCSESIYISACYKGFDFELLLTSLIPDRF